MLVQVVKEERGNEGAALAACLACRPLRCDCPNTARGGGVRKIASARTAQGSRKSSPDLRRAGRHGHHPAHHRRARCVPSPRIKRDLGLFAAHVGNGAQRLRSIV